MRRITCTSLLALLTFATAASAAPADEAITKPLKAVIGSIRQSRDLAALKHFAAEEQGKVLLGDEWAPVWLTPEMESSFLETRLVIRVISEIAVPGVVTQCIRKSRSLNSGSSSCPRCGQATTPARVTRPTTT